ncbi:MAG: hypothetical protein JWQ48_3823 [Conexibacter sp.]|nr:hypothetical protein [Conexibacter sp.]
MGRGNRRGGAGVRGGRPIGRERDGAAAPHERERRGTSSRSPTHRGNATPFTWSGRGVSAGGGVALLGAPNDAHPDAAPRDRAGTAAARDHPSAGRPATRHDADRARADADDPDDAGRSREHDADDADDAEHAAPPREHPATTATTAAGLPLASAAAAAATPALTARLATDGKLTMTGSSSDAGSDGADAAALLQGDQKQAAKK